MPVHQSCVSLAWSLCCSRHISVTQVHFRFHWCDPYTHLKETFLFVVVVVAVVVVFREGLIWISLPYRVWGFLKVCNTEENNFVILGEEESLSLMAGWQRHFVPGVILLYDYCVLPRRLRPPTCTLKNTAEICLCDPDTWPLNFSLYRRKTS